MKEKTKMEQIQLRLPKDLLDAIKATASYNGVSQQEMCRRILRHGVLNRTTILQAIKKNESKIDAMIELLYDTYQLTGDSILMNKGEWSYNQRDSYMINQKEYRYKEFIEYKEKLED